MIQKNNETWFDHCQMQSLICRSSSRKILTLTPYSKIKKVVAGDGIQEGTVSNIYEIKLSIVSGTVIWKGIMKIIRGSKGNTMPKRAEVQGKLLSNIQM